MSKHPPLPWRAYEEDQLCIHDALGRYVAEVRLDENDPEAHAIVSLIVLACNSHEELLAACREIMAMHEGPPNAVGNWDCAYDDLRAAIAKAEGK